MYTMHTGGKKWGRKQYSLRNC